LLPRMRALAGLSTEDADELALPALLDLPPAVSTLTRQAVLTGMVQRLPPRYGGATTPEQAWGMAGELATLFDEIALENADPALLHPDAVGDFTESWLQRLDDLAPPEQSSIGRSPPPSCAAWRPAGSAGWKLRGCSISDCAACWRCARRPPRGRRRRRPIR